MPDNLVDYVGIINGGGALAVLALCLRLLLRGEVVAGPIAREFSETRAALQTIAETSERAIGSFGRQLEQVQASQGASGDELKRLLAEFTASNKQVYRLLDRLLEQNQQVIEQNQQVLRQNQFFQQQLLDRPTQPEIIRRAA